VSTGRQTSTEGPAQAGPSALPRSAWCPSAPLRPWTVTKSIDSTSTQVLGSCDRGTRAAPLTRPTAYVPEPRVVGRDRRLPRRRVPFFRVALIAPSSGLRGDPFTRARWGGGGHARRRGASTVASSAQRKRRVNRGNTDRYRRFRDLHEEKRIRSERAAEDSASDRAETGRPRRPRGGCKPRWKEMPR